ncbi:MAG: hypothetical protein NT085_03555 [candidate division SR1 bacterium]|nr:hypothetical protein [candidate division SR1 bacterium]
MEQKKQLLIKVLKKLQPYRNLAEGILALVESSYVDEKTIDGIVHILAISIKNVKDTGDKKKMMKGLDVMKKIKTLEDQEHRKDEESAESILSKI